MEISIIFPFVWGFVDISIFYILQDGYIFNVDDVSDLGVDDVGHKNVDGTFPHDVQMYFPISHRVPEKLSMREFIWDIQCSDGLLIWLNLHFSWLNNNFWW